MEIPPAWEAAARRWLEVGGAALVLGAPDAGKSTLSRYLVYRAYAAGLPVGLVDLDLGQSHLGPPASLGLGLFPPLVPGDDSLCPQGLYFIGQTSPLGVILEVAVGCRVLADQGASQGINRLVVNTSGFVQGLGALRLKQAQAELLRPGLILALQQDLELEPLLRGLEGKTLSAKTPPPLAGGGWGEGEAQDIATPTPTLPHPGGGRNTGEETSPLQNLDRSEDIVGAGFPRPATGGAASCAPTDSGCQILRLPVSGRARRRDPELRRHYREERFRRYFGKAREMRLSAASFSWQGLPLGQGEALPPDKLRQFGQHLGVEVLAGEAQGRRVLLLTAQPPLDAAAAASAGRPDWDHVHWLSWEALQSRLVGLLDGRRRTLALGLILPAPWNRENLALLTPLAHEAAPLVRFVKLGKLRLNQEGEELPHV